MDELINIIENKTRRVNLNCKTHGDYTSMQTYLELTGKWVGGKCEHCINEKQEETVKSTHVELPKRYRKCTLDNYTLDNIKAQNFAHAVCQKYLNNFKERFDVGGCLIMSGSCGTGKTHLSCAIASAVALKGYEVLYTKVYDVVGSIKATWSNNGTTEQQAINEYCKPDLLIIDEIGVQFGSETEKLLLFRVLNKRYENEQTTIIISNLDTQGLIDYLGERLVDRFTENGGINIAFDWDSHRGLK